MRRDMPEIHVAVRLSGPVDPDPPTRLAPGLHTAGLVAVYLGLAAAGAALQHRALPSTEPAHALRQILAVYLPVIALEWGSVLYVIRGLRTTRTGLGALVGGDRVTPASLGRDVLLGLGTWVVWLVLAAGWERVWPAAASEVVRSLLPNGAAAASLWVLVSISAGICEEIVFRGYLQRQFSAMTGSTVAGLVLQAIVFGVAHGYQGWNACLRIVAYGLIYGVLARVRASLRPGMILHVWTDIAGGLWGL
jgi:membrane protease YdiL (CAAX protease family)